MPDRDDQAIPLRQAPLRDLGVRVQCYAGYRGEQEPRTFFFGERRVDVREIVDRWLEPERGYFKVRADDGAIYILRHDVPTGRWELTFYNNCRG